MGNTRDISNNSRIAPKKAKGHGSRIDGIHSDVIKL